MFCTVCAANNASSPLTCASCGAPLAGLIAAPRSDSTHRLWRVRAVGLLPLVALLLTFGFMGGEELRHRSELSNAYAGGVRALAAGDLLAAREAFASAEGYRDAPEQLLLVERKLTPYRVALDEATLALSLGRYDEAIATLLGIVRDLPGDRDALALLERVRAERIAEIEHSIPRSQDRGDWLAVEHGLAMILAERPDDPDAKARLAEVRAAHMPFVYSASGNIVYRYPGADTVQTVIEGMSAAWPAWSPDRTRIAFVTMPIDRSAITGNLYVINPDGTQLTLLSTQVLPYEWPVWSPDGTHVSYTNAAGFNVRDGTGVIAIHVIEIATGIDTNLTGSAFAFSASATWSPDSRRLAFVDRRVVRLGNGFDFENGDVHILDLASGAFSNVTRDRIQHERMVSWSPVDDRLLIITDPGDWTSAESREIYVLDLGDESLTAIPTSVRNPGPPAWSPDGQRVAFVESGDTIRVWSASGIEWVHLATSVRELVSWSADSTRLFVPSDAPATPSYILPIASDFGAREEVAIQFDEVSGAAGPPMWTPRSPGSGRPASFGASLDIGS